MLQLFLIRVALYPIMSSHLLVWDRQPDYTEKSATYRAALERCGLAGPEAFVVVVALPDLWCVRTALVRATILHWSLSSDARYCRGPSSDVWQTGLEACMRPFHL